MNRNKIILVFSFFIQLSLTAQCYKPFIEEDCYLDTENSLSEQWRHTTRRYIQQWGTESYYIDHYLKQQAVIDDSKYNKQLDSIYKECLSIFLDSLGLKNVCAQIELSDFRSSYYRKEKERLMRASFTFNFYYKSPRRCWNDASFSIKFTFKQTTPAEWDADLPKHFPDCESFENCNYPSVTNAQWVDKAIQDGFVDGTEEIELFDYDLKHKVLSYRVGAFSKRYLYYSLKTRAFVKDTFVHQVIYKNKDSRKYFNKADLIVDAKCFKIEAFDSTNMWSPRNHYFEVNHLIKGTTCSDTIVVAVVTANLHAYSMPDVGKRAILYLNEREQSSLEASNPVDTFLFEIWSLYIQPTHSNINNNTKFYTDLLPSIADLDSVRRIKAPIYIPEEVSKRMRFHKQEHLLDKQGVLVKIDNEFWSFDNSKWISHLYAFSCGDYSYPTDMVFNISYDSTIVGANIVGQGLVEWSPIRVRKSNRSPLFERTLSNNYSIELSDIAPNVFSIKISSKELEYLCQLPIKDTPKSYNYKPLLSIAIDVLDPEGKFRLDLQASAKQQASYYDPLEKEIKAYDYLLLGRREFTISKSKTQEIDEIVYTNFAAGDTITIVGKYLRCLKKKLYHPCSKIIEGIELRRHCKVPEEDIVECNDTRIRYIVNDSYLFYPAFKDPIDDFKPSSGTIKLDEINSGFIEQKKKQE